MPSISTMNKNKYRNYSTSIYICQILNKIWYVSWNYFFHTELNEKKMLSEGQSRTVAPTNVVIFRFGNFAKPALTKLDTFQLLLDLVNNIGFMCIALLHSPHQSFIDDLGTSGQQFVFSTVQCQITTFV